jgi:hypothetical protein
MTNTEQTDSLLDGAMTNARTALAIVSKAVNDHHADRGNVPNHLKEVEANLRAAIWRLRAAIEGRRS